MSRPWLPYTLKDLRSSLTSSVAGKPVGIFSIKLAIVISIAKKYSHDGRVKLSNKSRSEVQQWFGNGFKVDGLPAIGKAKIDRIGL